MLGTFEPMARDGVGSVRGVHLPTLRRRAISSVAVTLVTTLGLMVIVTACGGGDDSSVSSRDGSKDATTTTTADGGSATDGDAYVGLTKKAAIAKADAAGVPWRITREDDEQFPATLDYNPERVNFEIDDGKVTRATFG